MSATSAQAQGEVAGQITLLEAKSTAKHDVASAVVFLEPANKRGAQYSRPTGEYSSASIDMRNREFVPHIQIVRAGGSVEFPNNDPFSHNVFSNTSLGAFDLGLYRRGQSRTATFARAGVYSIYCNIHSAMVSFVIAVPTKDFSRVGCRRKVRDAGRAGRAATSCTCGMSARRRSSSRSTCRRPDCARSP